MGDYSSFYFGNRVCASSGVKSVKNGIMVSVLIGCLLGGGCADPTDEPLVPAPAPPPSWNWAIIPGEQAGPIDGNTSERDLRALFGTREVQRTEIPLGEGVSESGTVLFPGTDSARVDILWHGLLRQHPKTLHFYGDASRWTLPAGVSLGHSLREIEALNDTTFVLYGFGWDFGGAVSSWQEGRLADSLGPQVNVRFSGGDTSASFEDYEAVSGEEVFLSSEPAMQRLNPIVTSIIVQFPRPDATD